MYVYHELAHILTDKLVKKALDRFVIENDVLDEWENLSESIARIVLNEDTVKFQK